MYYNLANECDIKLAHLHGRIGTEQNTLRPGGHSKGENDMKRTKKVIALALVLVMAAALLSGCGETGSAGAAASGKTYNLVYQCAWGSGGRVTMECLATNSIVPTTDMLQAVSNGTLDCAQTAATNLSDDSLGILSTLPVGMTFDEYMGWYVAGEGQQILDEVMAEIDSNVVAFPCGVVDSEILYHSTTPITCLDDIKGLKIRGVSDWANIETRLGASVVTMDGGDCYEALSRGTIDAAEYSSPSANWAAGFQEVAPYLTVPGVHQSCAVYLFLINRGVWESMDEQTQNIIKLACTAMMAQNWAEDRVANGQAWEQFKELEAQGKLTIYRMPDEDIAKIQQVADEYYAEKCQSNPLFAKIYESQQAYIQSVGNWSEAASY